MADLTDIQAAQSVKIVGANSLGVETNPLSVDVSGNAQALINNASGASAVNIQDGGNSITVDALALPLPSGASTSTLQTTGNSSLSSLDAKTPTIGQKAMAASAPVVIASDQSPIPTKLQDGSGNLITSSAGELDVRDTIQIGGLFAALSITTVAVEAKVGVSKLANRKLLIITPTTGTVYWGLTSSVTVSTGTPIFKNQATPFGFEISVFLIAASTIDCRIVEVN